MAVYSASNALAGTAQALTTTYKTLTALTAQTTGLTRALVQEFDVGTLGTPADNVVQYDVCRCTTIGTGTNGTPSPLDTTLRAAATVATLNCTAEPTAGVSVFNLGLNQRASFRWVAAPGSELVIPAVNLAGFSIRALSTAYTGTASGAAVFIE
jgi:hypothetical protein